MNIELARTLTIALVNYLDENRLEGTMDCSSGECLSLEKAFTEENFDSVETLIKKKLSRLTEFEKAFIERVFHQKPEDLDEENKEIFREDARFVLALAREQLIKDGYVIVKKASYDAVKEVPPEVMKEVSDNVDKMEEELTEFELSLRQIIEVSLSDEVPNGSGGTMSWAVALSDDDIKKLAPKVLAIAKKELARRDEVITLDNLPPYDKGFQDGKAKAMADLERTFEYNPDKLPIWLKKELDRIRLESRAEDYSAGLQRALEGNKKQEFYRFPPFTIRPLCWEPGGICTNPQMDCINCPRINVVISPNTASGTSTLKAEG